MNLVVNDNTTGKANEAAVKTLSDIVKIVKGYRKHEYKEAFKLHQQNYPPIPNVTRWNAYMCLMQVLIKSRSFFDRLAANSQQ